MPYSDPSKQRAYAKIHYLRNKKKYIEKNRVRRIELKKYIRNLKTSQPCKDCGMSYPHYVMDFDHLADKEHLIGKFIANNNKSKLLEEIKKCEIVCANCHRIRTYSRMNLN